MWPPRNQPTPNLTSNLTAAENMIRNSRRGPGGINESTATSEELQAHQAAQNAANMAFGRGPGGINESTATSEELQAHQAAQNAANMAVGRFRPSIHPGVSSRPLPGVGPLSQQAPMPRPF